MGAAAAQKRRRVEQQQPQQQQQRAAPPHGPNDLVWAKLAPELPWWPARLAVPGAPSRGPTVAIEVLGAPGRTEILRVQRRRVDRDFRGSLGKHAEPWKRRKCAGIKRAFHDALAHARQLLAGGHARCARCGTWQGVSHDYVATEWSCPGGCASRTKDDHASECAAVHDYEAVASRTVED
jgi:hypothetical protein